MMCVCGHSSAQHRTTRLSVPLTASRAPTYPIKTRVTGNNTATCWPTATYDAQICDGGCGCTSIEPDNG